MFGGSCYSQPSHILHYIHARTMLLGFNESKSNGEMFQDLKLVAKLLHFELFSNYTQ